MCGRLQPTALCAGPNNASFSAPVTFWAAPEGSSGSYWAGNPLSWPPHISEMARRTFQFTWATSYLTRSCFWPLLHAISTQYGCPTKSSVSPPPKEDKAPPQSMYIHVRCEEFSTFPTSKEIPKVWAIVAQLWRKIHLLRNVVVIVIITIICFSKSSGHENSCTCWALLSPHSDDVLPINPQFRMQYEPYLSMAFRYTVNCVCLPFMLQNETFLMVTMDY